MKENKTSWLGVLATEEEVKQNGLKESNCVVNSAGICSFIRYGCRVCEGRISDKASL